MQIYQWSLIVNVPKERHKQLSFVLFIYFSSSYIYIYLEFPQILLFNFFIIFYINYIIFLIYGWITYIRHPDHQSFIAVSIALTEAAYQMSTYRLLAADWLTRGGMGCRDSKDVRAHLKTCYRRIRNLPLVFMFVGWQRCAQARRIERKDKDSATRARLFLIIRLAAKCLPVSWKLAAANGS